MSMFKKAWFTSSIGINGSIRVAEWIRDAILGTDSLDTIWIGDSNTGYNSWGWCDGWQHGLCQCGAAMYATPIFVPWNTQPNIGYRCQTFGSFEANTATGLVAGTGGSSGASAALKDTFDIGSGSLTVQGTAGNKPDFVDVTSARTGVSETALWLFMRKIEGANAAQMNGAYVEPCPIGLNEELIFRAQVNLRNTGTQKFTSRWANTGNSGLSQQSTTTVSASGDVWDIYTHTLAPATRFLYPATGVGTNYLRMAIDGSGVGTGNAVSAGTSVGLCSIYRNMIGTASSIMEFRGGATLTQIATDINEAKDGFCTTLLKEARERQIAAGGSGRVLIAIQGGVNSADWSPSTPAIAITAVESMKNDLKTAWDALGYPASDLLFLFMVSHPVDASDASLTVLRSHANSYYANSTDTMFVDLNAIAPYDTIVQNNWYADDGNAHLDEVTRGYEAIGSRIISRILAHY